MPSTHGKIEICLLIYCIQDLLELDEFLELFDEEEKEEYELDVFFINYFTSNSLF